MGKGELLEMRGKAISLIPQSPSTSFNPVIKIGNRIKELRLPSQLSGGEIQRIVLARIQSLKPEFIVADEPTSMLDVSVQAQILRLMQRIQDETGVSYLLISHDLEVLRAVCDRIAYLDGGAISMIEKI